MCWIKSNFEFLPPHCIVFMFMVYPPSISHADLEFQQKSLQPHVEFEQRSSRDASALTHVVSKTDLLNLTGEPSYISRGMRPTDNLLFEANIAPIFYVHFARVPLSIGVSPKVIIRMFSTRSNPVRTPSYMPRIMLFYLPKKKNPTDAYGFASLMLSHHSNGQEGCFYTQADSILGINPKKTTDCIDDAIRGVNTVNGSFSTNFFELSYYRVGLEANRKWALNQLKTSLEWHPGFNQSKELKGQYSKVRFNFSFVSDIPFLNYEKLRHFKIFFRSSMRVHNPPLKATAGPQDKIHLNPLSFECGSRFHLKVLDNFGFFASYYQGQDYYNLKFNKEIKVFRAGVTAEITPFVDQYLK